jgi:hypothetical protein
VDVALARTGGSGPLSGTRFTELGQDVRPVVLVGEDMHGADGGLLIPTNRDEVVGRDQVRRAHLHASRAQAPDG